MASPHGNDRGARWVDGDPTTGDIPRATTDEGNAKAEIVHSRQYVWDTVGLAWIRATPASGGGGGGAVTIADGADVAQGTTTDASSANTVIGLLKAIKTNTTGGSSTVNITGIAGTTPDVNSGLKSAGTLRVVLATDQPALTNKLLVTPDLPAGASTAAKQPALGTAGTASADVITVQGIASMTALKVDGSAVTQPVSGTVTTTPPANASTNVAQFGGTNVSTGTGAGGAGIPRVTVSNDSNVLATQSGTWTVQPGNTANTTPWLASLRPGTSGGLTTFHLVSAATTNATNIKASAGQVFGWFIYNSNAAARKVAFHNSDSAPTAGASIFFSLVIPPNSGANVFTDTGIAFSAGIGISTVTGLADSDATAVALNDLIINIFYA